MKYLLTIILILTAGLVQAATVSLPKGAVLVLADGIRYLVPAGARLEITDSEPMPAPPTPSYHVTNPYVDGSSWIFYPSLCSDPYYGHRYEDGYYSGYSGWTPRSNGPSCYPPWHDSYPRPHDDPHPGSGPHTGPGLGPGPGPHSGGRAGSPSAGSHAAGGGGGRGGGHR
ncbi:MAG: hypothetical protein ABSE84_02655 [Isosphaeraceae bacterium]|jgi:hypothetical protein